MSKNYVNNEHLINTSQIAEFNKESTKFDSFTKDAEPLKAIAVVFKSKSSTKLLTLLCQNYIVDIKKGKIEVDGTPVAIRAFRVTHVYNLKDLSELLALDNPKTSDFKKCSTIITKSELIVLKTLLKGTYPGKI